MKKKDFERIAKSLQPNLASMAVKGPLMFLYPLNGLLRGLCFERSSDAHKFYVWVFAMSLYVPKNYINFSLGHRISKNIRIWDVQNPNLEGELLSSIKAEAIPFLENIDTPEKFILFAQTSFERSKSPHIQQTIAYTLAATGEIQKAINTIDALKQQLRDSGTLWEKEIATQSNALRNLLVDNPDKARNQLALWEAETINNLGLNKPYKI